MEKTKTQIFPHSTKKRQVPVPSPVSPKKRKKPLPSPISVHQKYLTIKSTDDQSLIVPLSVMNISKMIMVIFGNYKHVSYVINLPFTGRILEVVVKYCFKMVAFNQEVRFRKVRRALFAQSPSEASLNPNNVGFVQIDLEDAMYVLMVSHYLDIPGLYENACRLVADNVDKCVSFGGLPHNVVFDIYSNVSPRFLATIESSDDHLSYFSDLDTSALWKKACDKRGWVDFQALETVVWETDLRKLTPITQQETPDWKAVFIQNDIYHCIKACSNGSLSDLTPEKFLKYYAVTAPYIRDLLVTESFTKLSEIEPFYLVSLSVNLSYLCITDYPFGVDLAIQLNDALLISEAKSLKSIKISRCSLDDDSMTVLSDCLEKLPLCLLDLSDNNLSLSSLDIVSRLIDNSHQALEYLSLRSNSLSQLETKNWFSSETDKESSPYPVTSRLENFLTSISNSQSLKVLDLSWNSLTFLGLQEEVFLSLGENTSLTYLRMNDNRLVSAESEAASYFFNNLPTNLVYLNMKNTGIESAHLEGFKELSDLVTLDISVNMLGSLSFHQSLPKSLQVLNLSSNYLWNDSITDLVELLRELPILEELALEKNYYDGDGIIDIVRRCLENTESLRRLSVKQNRSEGHHQEQLQELIANQSILTVDMQ